MNLDDHPTQTITRIVRFWINPDESRSGENSFAGKPSMSGFGSYHELDVSISGIPDQQTGYILGIQEIDQVVRSHLIPVISEHAQKKPHAHPGRILPELWQVADNQFEHNLIGLTWKFSPYYGMSMSNRDFQQSSVLLIERFEFAAAHRLHSEHMSDQENADFFGKCNNLHGHGHNYQIEVSVRVPINDLDSTNYQSKIQAEVNRSILDQLDHKFLNIDCDWFNTSKGGVIPSVENIARVCFDELAPNIHQSCDHAKLVRVQVWETEKTSSIYPG